MTDQILTPNFQGECPLHWLPISEGHSCLGCMARISPNVVRRLRGIIPINIIPKVTIDGK